MGFDKTGGELLYSRRVVPALQTLAVEAVVTQRGEDAIYGLIHALQTHRALGELGQVHHREAGALQRTPHVSLTLHSPAVLIFLTF